MFEHELHVHEVAHIVSFLPIDEIIKCRRVNNVWKRGVHSNQVFWKMMYCDYYRIDQYYTLTNDNNCCWLSKLLEITWKIPKKQNDAKDQPYEVNSLEIADNYQSFFKQEDDREDYYCTNTLLLEANRASFKFRKEIPLNVEDILDHYIITIVYDSLTVSGYTPNLFIDKVKAELCENRLGIEMTTEIPLLTFLSCVLKADNYADNFSKLSQYLMPHETVIQYDIGLNVENFTPMISPFELIEVLNVNDVKLSDRHEPLYLSNLEGYIFPSYYNAGGGYTDNLDLKVIVDDSDRRIVNIERTCRRDYY
ncbi:predicted protein [Naegleria gruberi]|uniref:Predicted protein n=1 Tax=Naegleria gruberi TaxID=5762 RepID=D2VA10_NAEGR|nr:uncharacterized protein NAEGRDRAFT_65699 [Naegleria gruberi]EFC46348.1 predicted protein [Naegleria gruberi]|eukprot:XP_002679092.1 predicted protein [Naegleria gruberi strain NEG-M]